MSTSTPKTAKCGTCRKPAQREGNKFYPFCSERCQLADLGRWLLEEYRVPDESTPVDAPGEDS